MTRSFSALLSVLFLAAALTVSGPAAAQAPQPVNFRLDFRLSGYHLPFYWAKAKGYFTQEGLAVDIKEGAGSGQTVNLVAAKEADIGLADYMLMANGISKGMSIIGVYGQLQKNPWAVISYQDAAIKTPKDLTGRSVAVIADHKALLDLLMKKNQIDPAGISLRVVNVATRNTIFADGKVDSFVSVAIGSPTDLVVRALEGKGKPLHFMQFADFGVSPIGQGLMVHKDYLAKNAEVVRKFIRASNRALADVLKSENVEEALDVALRESGVGVERRASLKLQWEQAIPTLQTDNSKGKPYGWMSDKDWKETVDILTGIGSVTNPPSLEALYTNAYIPER